MSENLDLVRSIFAAWERGDFTLTDWAHPNIEYVFADGPSPGRWTGLAGIAEGWRDRINAWGRDRREAEGGRELGLAERGETCDVVVDEVRVQRHDVPAQELAGSLLVGGPSGPPAKRRSNERLSWRLLILQVMSHGGVVFAHLSAGRCVEEA